MLPLIFLCCCVWSVICRQRGAVDRALENKRQQIERSELTALAANALIADAA